MNKGGNGGERNVVLIHIQIAPKDTVSTLERKLPLNHAWCSGKLKKKGTIFATRTSRLNTLIYSKN
jgi:hypothetical protein